MGLLSNWVESLDYDYEILPSCIRLKSSRSTCEKCLKICQKEAISFVKDKPVINKGKCVECGKCIAACPVQAVAGIFPMRTIFQNQLVITDQITPTIKELLVIYKKGIKSIISDELHLIELWKQQIDKANSMLIQLGEEPFAVSVKAVEKMDEMFSRRELFSFWKKESKSLMGQLLPARWRFNQNELDVSKYYPNYQFTRISVDVHKCTLCNACQQLCTKECLQFTENGFTISAQTCSTCQLCADTCPEHAILVEDCIMPVTNVFYPIYQKQCIGCHNTFITLQEKDEKCVMCKKQNEFYLK